MSLLNVYLTQTSIQRKSSFYRRLVPFSHISLLLLSIAALCMICCHYHPELLYLNEIYCTQWFMVSVVCYSTAMYFLKIAYLVRLNMVKHPSLNNNNNFNNNNTSRRKRRNKSRNRNRNRNINENRNTSSSRNNTTTTVDTNNNNNNNNNNCKFSIKLYGIFFIVTCLIVDLAQYLTIYGEPLYIDNVTQDEIESNSKNIYKNGCKTGIQIWNSIMASILMLIDMFLFYKFVQCYLDKIHLFTKNLTKKFDTNLTYSDIYIHHNNKHSLPKTIPETQILIDTTISPNDSLSHSHSHSHSLSNNITKSDKAGGDVN